VSEFLPVPEVERFPRLDRDPSWVRELPIGTHVARIFRASGPHAVRWHEFRSYGPLDGRFDPHPPPTGESPGFGVMYGVLESDRRGAAEAPTDPVVSPFATAILEVFQAQRMIRVDAGAPTLVDFAVTRPLRLLDLADSDWVTAAGGNAAIASGDRATSRSWARAIAAAYPGLDGAVGGRASRPSECGDPPGPARAHRRDRRDRRAVRLHPAVARPGPTPSPLRAA
jgi:hypothetical protein